MSVCKCTEKSKKHPGARAWVVTVFKAVKTRHHGWHFEYSKYSDVRCDSCNAYWRTNGSYIGELALSPHGADLYARMERAGQFRWHYEQVEKLKSRIRLLLQQIQDEEEKLESNQSKISGLQRNTEKLQTELMKMGAARVQANDFAAP